MFSFRLCQALWGVLVLLWIAACFVETPPVWVIAIWVPLFVVAAFLLGFGESVK